MRGFRRSIGPLVLSIGVILAGCMGGDAPVYPVEVSTAYDPQLTPEDDRARARSIGLREGEPATRGEPRLFAILERGSGNAASSGDEILCHPLDAGAVIDLSRRPHLYCFPLDETGETHFRVRVVEPVTIDRAQVIGPVTPDEECRYRGASATRAVTLDVAVDDALEVKLPYGIDC